MNLYSLVSSVQRSTVTSQLARLLRNEGWNFAKSKHFPFTPKHVHQFLQTDSILFSKFLDCFPGYIGWGVKIKLHPYSAEVEN